MSLTPQINTARRLAVVWGVHAVHVDVANENARLRDVIGEACRIAVEEKFAKSGEAIVIAAGLPFGTSGTTNLLHVAWIE